MNCSDEVNGDDEKDLHRKTKSRLTETSDDSKTKPNDFEVTSVLYEGCEKTSNNEEANVKALHFSETGLSETVNSPLSCESIQFEEVSEMTLADDLFADLEVQVIDEELQGSAEFTDGIWPTSDPKIEDKFRHSKKPCYSFEVFDKNSIPIYESLASDLQLNSRYEEMNRERSQGSYDSNCFFHQDETFLSSKSSLKSILDSENFFPTDEFGDEHSDELLPDSNDEDPFFSDDSLEYEKAEIGSEVWNDNELEEAFGIYNLHAFYSYGNSSPVSSTIKLNKHY